MESCESNKMQKKINSALKDLFGFDKFKGNQQQIIEKLLEGNDVFVIKPTGGGKSLCYQLPAMISQGTAIVISPLISLMKNQVDFLKGMTMDSSVAHFLNSTLNRQEIQQVKNDLLSGKTKLLYVAPESLTKQENIDLLKTLKILLSYPYLFYNFYLQNARQAISTAHLFNLIPVRFLKIINKPSRFTFCNAKNQFRQSVF